MLWRTYVCLTYIVCMTYACHTMYVCHMHVICTSYVCHNYYVCRMYVIRRPNLICHASVILITDPAITVPPTEPANDCPAGFALYRGNCYKADPTTRSWQAAEDQCKAEGGHLTSVANGYEMGFLISKFKGIANELWIGLTDLQVSYEALYK